MSRDTTAGLAKSVRENVNLRYWGDDGSYFQAWYPICLSEELPKGKILGVDFLNSRIMAYRDKDGKAVVQSSYCPHLGADISGGEMVEGEVRCPYHHWRFNASGVCSHIPVLGRGMDTATLYNYPVAERWGLVWAFNGKEPFGEFPTLIGVTEEDVVWRTTDLGTMNVESWILNTNAVDFQHLKAVHHWPHAEDGCNFKVDQTTLSFDFAVANPTGAGKLFYQNSFSMRDLQPFAPGHFVMPTSHSPRPNFQQSYCVLAVLKPDNAADLPAAHKRLDELESFLKNLNREDERIVENMRFRRPGDATCAAQWRGRVRTPLTGWALPSISQAREPTKIKTKGN